MVIRFDRKYKDLPGLDFLREVLATVNTRELREFKIIEGKSKQVAYPQIWGDCKSKTRKIPQHRISVRIGAEEGDFPVPNARYPRGKYGGGIRPEAKYENLDDVFVYVCMHEMYHYLAWTKQINGDHRDERAAIRFGYQMTDNVYRKFKS